MIFFIKYKISVDRLFVGLLPTNTTKYNTIAGKLDSVIDW